MNRKAIFYLCTDEGKPGTVSRKVWEILAEEGFLKPSQPAGLTFDGKDMMMHKDDQGNEFFFAQTEIPICWDYKRYLPEMNEKFSDFDFAGMITWHEGGNAPPKVLTVHTLGDVNSGTFGPADPDCMRNILLAIERNRLAFGLDDFSTATEATHWSGTDMGESSPELILKYSVPMVDIEVGSEEESWNNEDACRVLALALTQVFQGDGKKIHNLLCVGGMHFDPNFAQAVFTDWGSGASGGGDEAGHASGDKAAHAEASNGADDVSESGGEADHANGVGHTFGVSHIIPNQWLVSGEYDGDHGLDFASAAIDAIKGGVDAITFHDKMKGSYKDLVRALGEKYQIPILKHQLLRNPERIEF